MIFQEVDKQPAAVKPASHLEAVPLERDGSLNKKYRQVRHTDFDMFIHFVLI